MEFGPRALGNRSILADPRGPDVRDRLNHLIKQREDFRPFAPSVLAADAAEHFDLPGPSRFMLETCRVISPLDLPAITHVDGSARPQTVSPEENPRFGGLLRAFRELTGCPLLLNTSFNIQGQPIVRTAEDALHTMAVAGLDFLVLGDHLVDRDGLPEHWRETLVQTALVPAVAAGRDNDLYTFV
jgi:carbamoyltransferase